MEAFLSITLNVLYMKVALIISDYFSDEIQAEFLNFTIHFYLEIVKFKNLAVYAK